MEERALRYKKVDLKPTKVAKIAASYSRNVRKSGIANSV
jgi:hypothetical protein